MDNSQAKMLVATQKYERKAMDLVKAGLHREPILDIPEKIKVGAKHSGGFALEEKEHGTSAGGMMLYTSGTTNRPVRCIFNAQLHKDNLFADFI
jgi:hypothetical protein